MGKLYKKVKRLESHKLFYCMFGRYDQCRARNSLSSPTGLVRSWLCAAWNLSPLNTKKEARTKPFLCANVNVTLHRICLCHIFSIMSRVKVRSTAKVYLICLKPQKCTMEATVDLRRNDVVLQCCGSAILWLFHMDCFHKFGSLMQVIELKSIWIYLSLMGHLSNVMSITNQGIEEHLL